MKSQEILGDKTSKFNASRRSFFLSFLGFLCKSVAWNANPQSQLSHKLNSQINSLVWETDWARGVQLLVGGGGSIRKLGLHSLLEEGVGGLIVLLARVLVVDVEVILVILGLDEGVGVVVLGFGLLGSSLENRLRVIDAGVVEILRLSLNGLGFGSPSLLGSGSLSAGFTLLRLSAVIGRDLGEVVGEQLVHLALGIAVERVGR